jgi:hypothetical protein
MPNEPDKVTVDCAKAAPVAATAARATMLDFSHKIPKSLKESNKVRPT